MVPSITTRSGTRRYRYYTCSQAQKCGWASCPSKAVPAGQIEKLVLQQIRAIGKDPVVVAETFAQADAQARQRMAELALERAALERDLAAWNTDMRNLVGQVGGQNPTALSRLADLQERLCGTERRLTEVREQLAAHERQQLTEHEVEAALAAFDPVWEALTPREQTRLVQLLVERVDYDGARGKLAITFHATGIKTLAAELSAQSKEMSA
jgi:site-specific DNA recombinase